MPRHKKVKWGLLLLCSVASLEAKPVVLNHANDLILIGQHLDYFEDSSAAMPLRDVKRAYEQKKFQPVARNIFSMPATRSALWFRFELQNFSGQDAWLEFGSIFAGEIDFYDEDGRVISVGSLRPDSNKAYDTNLYWFPLSTGADKKNHIYYLRVREETPLGAPLKVGTLVSLGVSRQSYDFIAGGFITVMLVMFLFNLFLYVTTKDSIYVPYLFYLLCAIATNTFVNNFPIIQYLTANIFAKENWFRYFLVWQPLMLAPIGIFGIQYLELRFKSSTFYKIIIAETLIFALGFPLATIAGAPLGKLIGLYEVAALVLPLTCFAAALTLYLKGDKTARLYLLGWSAFIAAIAVLIGVINGLIPHTPYTRNSLYFGVIIEALLFSLALTDRLNRANRKQIERGNKLLMQASRLSRIGGWEFLPSENRFYWSDMTRTMHDAPEDFVPTPENAFIFYTDRKSRVKMVRAFTACLEAGTPYDIELKVKSYTGRDVWIRTIGEPEFAGKLLVRIYGTSQDITQQKIVALELADAKNRAEMATKARTQFLATMSHEIRTPLTGLIGMISLLKETKLESEQQQYTNIMAKSGDTLMSLVNDILDFTRFETGSFALRNEPFDLASAARDVLGLMSARASEKKIVIDSAIDPQISYHVMGDEFRVKQIIANLLGNAIKFTAEGGAIVSLRQIGRQSNRVEIEINVRDTGIGIPLDKISLLFKPFSQADYSVTRRFGGSGLGLSICKQLADKMGGRLTLSSAEGKGTTVTLVLSFEIAKAEDPALPHLVLDENYLFHRKYSVLIVDDDEIIRSILRETMLKLGFAVEEATDGIDAFTKFGAGNFDFITMDTNMPRMGGHDAIRQIRAATGSFEYPVIISISAVADTDKFSEVIRLGANDVITKPFTFSSIRALMIKWDQVLVQSRPG